MVEPNLCSMWKQISSQWGITSLQKQALNVGLFSLCLNNGAEKCGLPTILVQYLSAIGQTWKIMSLRTGQVGYVLNNLWSGGAYISVCPRLAIRRWPGCIAWLPPFFYRNLCYHVQDGSVIWIYSLLLIGWQILFRKAGLSMVLELSCYHAIKMAFFFPLSW